MNGGWRYRLAGFFGTAALAAVAVVVANQPPVRAIIDIIPLLSHLPADAAKGDELVFEVATSTAVVTAALVPLFKPRPRRILDIGMLAVRRTTLALLALATIGYFDYTYRLPRVTLIVAGCFLLVAIPAWFVAIRRQPRKSGDRIVIVGDDPDSMADILRSVEGTVVGYISPPSAYFGGDSIGTQAPEYADGGSQVAIDDLTCLSGLSHLDEVLVDHDIDTAVLAFAHPDREEFFGTLDICYEHGVSAKVHRDHADAVLTRGMPTGDLVEIDLEPWDWQDHAVKRVFDVCFAATALVVTAPVLAIISLAIKVDDGGPVLYSQERTAALGDTFTIYKFRTMRVGVVDSSPSDDETNDRITRVGQFLRRTHLDEIPQLWPILTGKMSVVGPRAVWTEEEKHLERATENWRQRWFVKPGLTGLAQVNGASSLDPEAKLRYDVEYIRKQSFWFDVKIVVRQLWMVLEDVVETVRN